MIEIADDADNDTEDNCNISVGCVADKSKNTRAASTVVTPETARRTTATTKTNQQTSSKRTNAHSMAPGRTLTFDGNTSADNNDDKSDSDVGS